MDSPFAWLGGRIREARGVGNDAGRQRTCLDGAAAVIAASEASCGSEATKADSPTVDAIRQNRRV